MASPPAPPPLGARVLLGGQHRATVRYVGAVDGQQGTWVGLEWDEAARGKHDGEHACRRYFSTAQPTAGSLVRLPKFLEAVSYGRSLAEAAEERYGSGGAAAGGSGGARPGSGDGTPTATQQQTFLATAGHRRVAVEVHAPVLDASRRQSASGGVVASLVAQSVSSVGPAAQLQAALPSLTELDLSDNLVADWAFVAELAAALPSLHTLNLSGNRLALPSLAPGPLAPPPASLARLQVLVLNGCGVSWQQAVAVARQLPALRELRLCRNRLASLALPRAGGPPPAAADAAGGSSGGGSDALVDGGHAAAQLAAAFSRLELLDLEENELASWHEVAALGALPALRTLALSGNRLEAVEYTGGFASLRCLLLGGNRLAGWSAVDQMDRFPALQEARLSDNPLTAAAPAAARYQCIARVARLSVLNASAVSAAERWDAELSYLRLTTDEAAAAGADAAARAAALAAHPRFAALTARYGELTPAAPKAAAGTALAASMAQLTIACGSKELQKKLPVSLTVGKLKLMLERLLRVKAAEQALLLVPPPDSGAQPEDITDDDSRELRYFDAADGCRLEVSNSDPAARAAALAAARAAAAASHAQRMQAHEAAIQQFRAEQQRLMAAGRSGPGTAGEAGGSDDHSNSNFLSPESLARRVERAERSGGGGGGDGQQQPGADAAAFVALNRLCDGELDELFLGRDSCLLQLTFHETPLEQLPVVPPRRLLRALLAYVRASLPTPFRYLTNLTRVAMQKHLEPFMLVCRVPTPGASTGMSLAIQYPPTLPVAARLSLRGEPPAVPWPAGGGTALLVVKAALAAREYLTNDVQCSYWVAERALRALGDAATAAAVQAELASAGSVPDPAAALSDLRYACHETCASQLIQQDAHLEAAGQGEEWRAAFQRHAAALVRERPDMGAAWALAAFGHYRGRDHFRAQVTALKGLAVADAAADAWHGACLRQVLAGSIALSGEVATPGRLRVGLLRRLIGEVSLLQRRYRSWVPKGETPPTGTPGAVAFRFFDARGYDQEHVDALPNDAVEPCFGGMQRRMFQAFPGEGMSRRCSGCKEPIEGEPKLCGRCRAAAYHNAQCQRAHWHAGHRHQCQPVEAAAAGGPDWAAEAAAAEAGLAAWEQGGEGGEGVTAEQRLGMEQLRAVMEQREAAGQPLRNGDLMGLMGFQMGGPQCPQQ